MEHCRVEQPQIYTFIEHTYRTNYGQKCRTGSWLAKQENGHISETVCSRVKWKTIEPYGPYSESNRELGCISRTVHLSYLVTIHGLSVVFWITWPEYRAF